MTFYVHVATSNGSLIYIYIYILCILSFNSLIKVYICLTWIVAEQSTLCWFKITTVKVSIIVLLFFIWLLCFIIADFSPGMAIFLLVPIIGSSCFNGDDVLFIWMTFCCFIFVVCFCCVFVTVFHDILLCWLSFLIVRLCSCTFYFYFAFVFPVIHLKKSCQHNVLIGLFSTYITLISLGVKYQPHAD